MANFDPATFGLLARSMASSAPSGGLLDFLRDPSLLAAMPQAGQQTWPNTPGMQGAPTPAMEKEASPIAIGNYMMPRHGPASLYEPQPAALPPNAQPTQGQMPPQQQTALPPAMGGSQPTNGFIRGLQSIGNGGGLISALTGKYNDPVSVQQQNMRAQYDALVPLMGAQKAMLSIMNPEAGKAFLAEITDKPTYGVIGKDAFGNEKYGFIHPTKQKVVPTSVPETATAQPTVTGPDGKEIPIPPGVDPKAFRKQVTDATADAATGKKTEVQAKSEKFGNKMETAESQMRLLEKEGTRPVNRTLESVPGGNYLQSESYQKYKQARDNFITALLRDESGAAIGTQEFNRYERELFPQPGDSDAVIKQKQTARKVAIEGMKKSAGPGYKSPDIEQPEQANAERSAIEAEMRRRGLLK